MPTFDYNRDIPDGPHNPSSDVTPMKINTNSIDDIINVDHFSFEQGNKDGTHKQVTLTNETAPALPAGTNNMLYSASLGVGKPSVLWVKSSVGVDLPLYHNASLGVTNGYTSAYGNIIIQFGSISGAPIANGATITFPRAFDTRVLSVTLGPESNSTNDKTINILTGSVTLTGFTIITSGTSSFQKLYWTAIGQ